MIEKRVRDGTILRLIGKWINVGVIEDGRLRTLDELPQPAEVLRAGSAYLAEVAQPEKSWEYSALARLRPTSSTAPVITTPFVASVETGVSTGEFGLRNRLHQRARSVL